MDLMDQAQVAVESIRSNKLRSFLTTLGVVIGVTSVILLVAIGEGLRTYLSDVFAGMGSNLLFVSPGKRNTRGSGQAGFSSVNKLTLGDVRALRQRSFSIVGVAPRVVGGGTIRRASFVREGVILGSDDEFLRVHNLKLASGRFITREDSHTKRRIAVIGQTIANELFGDRSPLGQPIKIADARFRVVGIMAAKGQSLGIDYDEVAFVPVSIALDLFNLNGLSGLSIKAANKTNLQPAISDIKQILKNRHNNKEDFTIISQADLLQTANQITGTMTLVLLGIASISLLVGGIGIMNIMLVSVRERTREIGVRKAVGAKKRDILIQFLMESVMVSLLGGLIGLLCGTLLSIGISSAIPAFPPPKITLWAVFLAVGFSVGVGVFFGVTPAKRAANQDPIHALRYE